MTPDLNHESEGAGGIDAKKKKRNGCRCTLRLLACMFFVRRVRRFERELGRKTYTTPTSYLELIKLYLEMLGTQRESVRINESRYRNGLQKLEETKVMVNELQVGAITALDGTR